jgi:DNA repair protein RadC
MISGVERRNNKKSRKYMPKQDVIYFGLAGIPKNFVPELKVRYNKGKLFLGKVTRSEEVATFIRKIYGDGEIELQEAFVILYLNTANEIIGYYKHTKGAIAATIVDTRIVFSVALQCLATRIILSHNHPSGNIQPSEADLHLTNKLEQAGELLEIRVLDHVIITKNNYYSFADHGKI